MNRFWQPAWRCRVAPLFTSVGARRGRCCGHPVTGQSRHPAAPVYTAVDAPAAAATVGDAAGRRYEVTDCPLGAAARSLTGVT